MATFWRVVDLGNGNGSVILASPRNAVDLLAEFRQTGRQEAFEEIVRRYAAMVFGVCLKTTRNAHDAEDATQAVFLNLATHCKTNGQPITYVGPWLQKVARRVSLDIRRSKKRRQVREETHASHNGNGHVEGGQDGVDVEELKVVLNEELHQLPAKYRLPMILHYFGGLSREEMAKELGCKPSTLGVRIHRGRQMLAERLTERGAGLGHLSLGMALTISIRDAVSDGMIVSTSKAAADMLAGKQLGSMISSHVLAFSHGAAGVALIAKLKTAAAVILIAALTLAAAAGAVAKVVPLEELKLQWQLRFQGLFRLPRLQSPFRAPYADSGGEETDSLAAAARSLADDAAVQTVMWLADEPPIPDGRHSPSDGSHGQPRHAFSAPVRLIAQLVSTVVGSNGARPSQAAPRQALPADEAFARGGSKQPVSASLSAGTPGAGVVPALPPRQDLRPSGAIGGDGKSVAVAGGFAGGVARAGGSVVLGHDALIYPLLPPARLDGFGGATWGQEARHTPLVAPGTSLTVGGPGGSHGAVTIDRGALAVDTQLIGQAGHGELTHRGGTNVARNVRLGQDPGGVGVYNLNSDQLLLDGNDPTTLSATAGAPLPPTLDGIEVGHNGDGQFNIGDANGSGQVSEYGDHGAIGGSLVVRGGPAGSGLVRGNGLVYLHGFFDQNGKVVADGYGQERSLEFSGFRYVGNSIDNPAAGGTNGWFARDHGRLVLPNLHVKKGTGTYTWGEDPTDPTIDLVNSARVTIHDAAADGLVRISLLSLDSLDVPTLPTGHHFIGVWKFEDGGLQHGPVDLLVRYDDGLAAQLKLDENVLKLWRYHDGQWLRINDASFSRDVSQHLIGGTTDELEYFAVSAPEPGAAFVLLLGGGAALLRRRRHPRA